MGANIFDKDSTGKNILTHTILSWKGRRLDMPDIILSSFFLTLNQKMFNKLMLMPDNANKTALDYASPVKIKNYSVFEAVIEKAFKLQSNGELVYQALKLPYVHHD